MQDRSKKQVSDYKAEIMQLRKEVAELAIENEIMLKAKLEAEAFSKRKSEFLANMSHELRTPMHAILSFSKISLKKMGVLERAKLRKNIEIIYESGHRLLHTLNDVLDISKLESGRMEFEMEEYDFCKLLNSVIQELQSLLLDKGIRYQIEGNNPPVPAYFDKRKIIQVMQNILGNAIKFSPLMGSIYIEITEQNFDNEEFLKVSISNYGQPIPQAELESIFNKYFQSSAKSSHIGGTGLGLSISRQIIEGHGGKIWAECKKASSSYKTSFNFTLPRAEPTQTNQKEIDHAS